MCLFDSFDSIVPLRSINLPCFFGIATVTTTRRHAYKLFNPSCTSAVRNNFFTEHVIDVWNNLPSTVNFTTLTTFRRTIAGVDLSKYIKSTIISLLNVLFYFTYFCIYIYLCFHGRLPECSGPFRPACQVFCPVFCIVSSKIKCEMCACMLGGANFRQRVLPNNHFVDRFRRINMLNLKPLTKIPYI